MTDLDRTPGGQRETDPDHTMLWTVVLVIVVVLGIVALKRM